jgi:phosphate transport system protein
LVGQLVPAASDLRFVAASLEMVSDLERIGDLAVNMAERVAALAEEVVGNDSRTMARGIATIFFAKHIERMADHTTNVAEMVIYLIRGQDVRHGKSS